MSILREEVVFQSVLFEEVWYDHTSDEGLSLVQSLRQQQFPFSEEKKEEIRQRIQEALKAGDLKIVPIPRAMQEKRSAM